MVLTGSSQWTPKHGRTCIGNTSARTDLPHSPIGWRHADNLALTINSTTGRRASATALCLCEGKCARYLAQEIIPHISTSVNACQR